MELKPAELESEKQEILRWLRNGRAALADSLAGVEQDLARRKPPSGGWSILECVEHLAIAEEILWELLQRAYDSGQSHQDPQKEAWVIDRALNRARPIQSPEQALPIGRFDSLDSALAAFDASYAEVLRFTQDFNGDMRCWLAQHPMVSYPINCYEYLLIISLHPARHAKQILEIRNALAPH